MNNLELFLINTLLCVNKKQSQIVQIWETYKKHVRAKICSTDKKMLIFKNSLFSRSESSSDHCQISKMECFEKVVDGFELLTNYFRKTFHFRCLAGLWIQLCCRHLFQTREETNPTAGSTEVNQIQKNQAFKLLFAVRSIF